jgi:hypothetical protein
MTSSSNDQELSRCPDCRAPVDNDTCYCGVRIKDHTQDDGHTAAPLGCLCHVDVDDILNVVDDDLVRLSVSSNTWVMRVRDILLLFVSMARKQDAELKRQRTELESLRKRVLLGPLPQHPDADYDGIEEAYRSPVGTGTQTEDRDNRGPLFTDTEPPPQDKETSLFKPKPVYTEAETQAAVNVPCMFCGMFPKAEKDGTVYCEDTCWGTICPMFPPQKWIDENGDKGWRIRELRRRAGDDI